MLEMMMPSPGPMPAGPSGAGPGQSKIPDCGSYSCSLAFDAVMGMDIAEARNNLEADAASHVVENLMRKPVSIADFLIKNKEARLNNGSLLKKEMLFSENSDQSLQEVTNFEEESGQVWRQIDEISDSIINSPVDSWHALLSPDQTSGDNHRMTLFHKKDEANVREYYVTVNSSMSSLNRLRSNLQNESQEVKDDFFIFTASGRSLGDFYPMIENTYSLPEKTERRGFLERLKQDTQTGDSFILQRQEKVREAVAREADEILKDDISLTAIGLLGQSLGRLSEQISAELSQNINNKEMPRITTRIEPERKIEERRETQPLYSERDVDEREEKEPELNSITKQQVMLKSPRLSRGNPAEAGQFQPSIPDQPLFAEITPLISQAILSLEQHNVLKDNGIPVFKEGKVPAEISPIIIQAFLNQINNPENLPELEKNSSKDIPEKAGVVINPATPENNILSVFVPIIVQAIINQSNQKVQPVPDKAEIYGDDKKVTIPKVEGDVNNKEPLLKFLEKVEKWVDIIFKIQEDENEILSERIEKEEKSIEQPNIFKDNGIPVFQEGKVPAEISPIIIQAFLNQINNPENLPEKKEEPSTEIPAEITSLIVQAVTAESFRAVKKIPGPADIKKEKNEDFFPETQNTNSVSQERLVEFLERIEELAGKIFKRQESVQRIPLEINQPDEFLVNSEDESSFLSSVDFSDILFTDKTASEFIKETEKQIVKLLVNKPLDVISLFFPEAGLTDIDFEDSAEINITVSSLLIIGLLSESLSAYYEEDINSETESRVIPPENIFINNTTISDFESVNPGGRQPEPQVIIVQEIHKMMDWFEEFYLFDGKNDQGKIIFNKEKVINGATSVMKTDKVKKQIEKILMDVKTKGIFPVFDGQLPEILTESGTDGIPELPEDLLPVFNLLIEQGNQPPGQTKSVEANFKAIQSDLNIAILSIDLMMKYRQKKELDNSPVPKILPLIVNRQIEVLLSLIKVNKLVILWLFLLLIKEKSFNLKRDDFEPVKTAKVNKKRKNILFEQEKNPYEIWSILRSLISTKYMRQSKKGKSAKTRKLTSWGLIFAYQPLVNSL